MVVTIKDREKPSEIFGEPIKGPDGWRVGEVKETPAWSQQPESSYTKINLDISKVEKEYISRRKILIWLEKVEEGIQVTYRLYILIRPMRQQEAEEECTHIRAMLGFGEINLYEEKYLLFIPQKHQSYFLKMMQKYLPDRRDIDKAIRFLDFEKAGLFRKGEEKDFEEEYTLLLE